MYASHIPSQRPPDFDSKRKAKKRRQQAKLECGNGHFATWMKVTAIHKLFGITTQPGKVVKIPTLESKWCSECSRAEKKEAARIHHLYRPEQKTLVTLHKVFFAYNIIEGDDKFYPCRASFYARVSHVDNDDLSVTFILIPIDGVTFQSVRPIASQAFKISPQFGARLQRTKKGLCFVKLTKPQLDRELGLVVLGRRCKPDRCGEDGCEMHNLRPPMN